MLTVSAALNTLTYTQKAVAFITQEYKMYFLQGMPYQKLNVNQRDITHTNIDINKENICYDTNNKKANN